ncbi:MAG: TerC family protein [Verrucomicrobiales bacterium]|nr:TerC family protein [Verrucomicrobiales bacterium]MCP5526445.1 TerC family protein [Verrucomicrobiales bacterium]
MDAVSQIQWWHWASFVLMVLIFLAMDLGLFHRQAREVRFREALGWTCLLVFAALVFAWTLVPVLGRDSALEFLTGYLIELSLSMDNVFVIAVIFQYFAVPRAYQHRVLFWGIMGALAMRGLMIWLGAELVEHYHWTLYLFGLFLVFTGIKMLVGDDAEVQPEANPVVRLVCRFFPVAKRYDAQRFTTFEQGRRILTPLAVVLVMVETTDLIFALDSIPAIFGITTDRFIIFTSNVFAILGLRSLYFVLAGAVAYFCYLKFGLAIVLVLVGFKMLVADWIVVPTIWSLAMVGTTIITSMLLSLLAAKRGKRCCANETTPPPPAT